MDLFAPILERLEYKATISDTLDTYLDTELMRFQDLIVQMLQHFEVPEAREIVRRGMVWATR